MNIAGKIDYIAKKAKTESDYFEPRVPAVMANIDVELNKIMEEYRVLPSEERQMAKSSISNDSAWMLLSFAENMATYSLRLSEEKAFVNGLLALSLIKGILDTREVILLMALYYDAHKKRGLGFENLLEGEDDFAEFVKEFLRRDEEDKTLESMGYVVIVSDKDGLTYRRTW